LAHSGHWQLHCECPLLGPSGHEFLRCEGPLMTQSGHWTFPLDLLDHSNGTIFIQLPHAAMFPPTL
jgi:hypothetical protein